MSFLDELRPDSVEWLSERGHLREYGKGCSVFLEGDPPLAVYVIRRGLLRIERVSLNGQTQMLALAARGDIVGELAVVDASPRSANAVAMLDSTVLVIPSSAMTYALENFPDVPLAISRLIAERLRLLTTLLVETSSGTARSRVAARLMSMLDDDVLDGPVDLDVQVSQAELAAWAGLSREGAVKALRELRGDGILTTARRNIRILDVSALRAEADCA